MIHYHGLPITPDTTALSAIKGGHAFISFRYPDQLGLALEQCQSFALDNGAFSSWKSGESVQNWLPYYEWVNGIFRRPGFDFAVIPDVIDGSEEDNDKLIEEWPFSKGLYHRKDIGAPVWHLHESLLRLKRLALEFPRVCLGSSGKFASVNSPEWHERMREAMDTVCDSSGFPYTRLHGLRMLNPRVFEKYPLSSADSTNIARNVNIDVKWKGTYLPSTKSCRAQILRERIEFTQSLPQWGK